MSSHPGIDAGPDGLATAGHQDGAPATTHHPTTTTPQLRTSRTSQGLQHADNDSQRHAAEHSPRAADASADKLDFPFHIFLYGPLMDSDVLQAVLGIARRPILRPGSIRGWQTRMYGSHPAILRQTIHGQAGDNKVTGLAWECRSLKQLARLQDYESEAYVLRPCEVILDETNELLLDSRVFCWAGHPESEELREGMFDLEWYREHLKPAFVSD